MNSKEVFSSTYTREFFLIADREESFSLVILCNFKYAIAPVVRAFRVSGIINVVIDDNKRTLRELEEITLCANCAKAVPAKIKKN